MNPVTIACRGKRVTTRQNGGARQNKSHIAALAHRLSAWDRGIAASLTPDKWLLVLSEHGDNGAAAAAGFSQASNVASVVCARATIVCSQPGRPFILSCGSFPQPWPFTPG